MAFFSIAIAFSIFIFPSFAQSTLLPKTIVKYANLPLAFEENRGQVDSEVLYLLRQESLNVFVTGKGAVLSLKNGRKRAAVRLEIVDGSRNSIPSGEVPLAGKSNYFHGKDPAKWLIGLAQYQKVRLSEVRPGVDLLYYANGKELEYDLVIKPGAAPENVRVRFAGAQKTGLTADGELKIKTFAGDLIQHKPLVWQQSPAGRKIIAASYKVSNNGEVSVLVGKYDHTQDLVIDPVVTYSTFLGGAAAEGAAALAVDAAGNIYISGNTYSADFPTAVGAFQVSENNTSDDAFVSKLNPAGTALIYSTYLGGSSIDTAAAIAVDSSGNAYVAGTTFSTDFPVTAGVFQNMKKSLPGAFFHSDAFVTKINSGGTALIYSTYLGGATSQIASGMQVDSSGNAYIVGYTTSADFPTTAGAYRTAIAGPQSAFVTKLNSSATQLVYSTFLGGSGYDAANAIALDSANNAYIVGSTQSIDFPATAGSYQVQPATANNSNAFVARLSGDGAALTAATYLGGGGSSSGTFNATELTAIALDASNNPYVTGKTASISFPTTPGAFSTTPGSGNTRAVVVKLNPTLTSLTYSSYLGGVTAVTIGNGISVDSTGRAYVAGLTFAGDFPTTAGAIFRTKASAQNQAGFLTQVNPSGSALLYSTFLGGTADTSVTAVAIDASLGVYLTGSTTSRDFPVTAGAYQTASTDLPASQNPGNAFVTKLDLNSAVSCILSLSPATYAAPLNGGTSSFAITVPQGCPWLLSTVSSAITFNGPTHGFGNATVSFSVGSNASSSQLLIAPIVVGSSTFSITQPAGSCSAPFFAPSSASFATAGGTGSLSVAIPYGCVFSALAPAPWITVNLGSPNYQSGTIAYTVDRNDFASRSASLLVDNIAFPLTQAGAGCTASTSVVSGSGAAGGTGTISLTTSANTCLWKAYSLASWIQLGSITGSGAANIGLAIAPNSGTLPRIGQIQIAGQTLSITQAAGPVATAPSYKISTLAGTGISGFSGDGGLATSATLNTPGGLAYDAAGNLFIADFQNNRVRKVGLDGRISTVAGNGSATESGDGSAALTAGVEQPFGVSIGPAGELYILDVTGFMAANIRKVAGGAISTVATGVGGSILALDSAANFYVGGLGFIQKVTPAGAISLFAGSGTPGFQGDGGSPSSARMGYVNGIVFDKTSNLYLSDANNNRIRRIAGNVISTVAGIDASPGFNGDGPATSSSLLTPKGLALDPAGNLVILDSANYRVRRLTSDGNLTTIAGSGTSLSTTYFSSNADGSVATSAPLGVSQGIAIDSLGNIAVSDTTNNVIRLLTPAYSFCTYSLSSTTGTALASGGNLGPVVTTTTGCVWNVLSSASWITAASPSTTGSGPGSLQIAANLTASTRTGTVSIAGQTFSVTQAVGGQTPQSITFAPLASAVLGTTQISITATASSSLPLTFASTSLSICTVTGSTITLVAVGLCSITANQAGNATYMSALPVTQSFTVQAALRITKAGVFRAGFYWLEDVNGDQQFTNPPDRSFAYGGVPGDIPITGDWTGSGTTKVGVYRPTNGLFILDSNGNGNFDAGDAIYNLGLGIQPGDIPVIGDWNGDGRSKVGLFRNGYFWILDFNGNGVFDQGTDKAFAFGGDSTDIPVVGDWSGNGITKVGVLRKGFLWILDMNGNGTFDGVGPGQDAAFAYGGIPGDVPVVGDWNGSGTTKVGVFRYGYFWILDKNGNQQFDGTGPGQDIAFGFGGSPGDKPVLGIW